MELRVEMVGIVLAAAEVALMLLEKHHLHHQAHLHPQLVVQVDLV
jgi:hypothetical protein